MIEIGKSELVTVRVKDKSTGKLVPKIGADGEPVQELREKRVYRITRAALDGHFCRDSGRRLVVALVGPDQIIFRPQGTRQELRINVIDCYRIAIQRRANVAVLERARQRKETKQRQRESASIKRADKRLTRDARATAASTRA